MKFLSDHTPLFKKNHVGPDTGQMTRKTMFEVLEQNQQLFCLIFIYLLSFET